MVSHADVTVGGGMFTISGRRMYTMLRVIGSLVALLLLAVPGVGHAQAAPAAVMSLFQVTPSGVNTAMTVDTGVGVIAGCVTDNRALPTPLTIDTGGGSYVVEVAMRGSNITDSTRFGAARVHYHLQVSPPPRSRASTTCRWATRSSPSSRRWSPPASPPAATPRHRSSAPMIS